MKIGDITPYPEDAIMELVPGVRYRRALTKRLSSLKGGNQAIMAARKAVQETREAIARNEMPVERAKTFLRSRGYRPVFSDVRGHHAGMLTFSSKKALMEFAKSKGWGG